MLGTRPATLETSRWGVRSHGLYHADLVTDERAPWLGGHACTSSRQRRWRQTRRSNAANGGPAGSVAHQNIWLTTNAVDELTPPAVWSGPLEAKGFGPFKGHLITYGIVAGPHSRMRHGLQGHECVTFHQLALIEACDPWVKVHRNVRGLDESPTEILVAVFGVPLAFDFAMTEPLTLHAATIGGKVPHARNAPNVIAI